MNKYKVVVSEEAQQDLRNLSDVISYQYKAPLTSLMYLNEIYAEMHKLSISAASYKIQMRKSLQQYAPSPRRINYKRMAIIYNIVNNVVYIRRVIPSNTIAGL
jgi:hypothetical protein